jgi:hypothetical protein
MMMMMGSTPRVFTVVFTAVDLQRQDVKVLPIPM